MEGYIGGEFSLKSQDFCGPMRNSWPLPTNAIFLDTGRAALLAALQECLQKGVRTAWLPGYCCPSVLQPFRQLGFELQFYSMGKDLQHPENLPVSLKNEVFLFINYFGKKNMAIEAWLQEVPRSEYTIIIEDNVQASLNESSSCKYDFSISSFRKFLPQPDGALLVSKQPLSLGLEPANEAFVSAKTLGKWLRHDDWTNAIFLDLFAQGESLLEGEITLRAMSWLSAYLFARTDIKAIAERRRRNWQLLSKALQEARFYEIQLLYGDLEPGEVPVGFPVLVGNKRRNFLREKLADQHIFCPIHWRLEAEQGNEAEKYLSETILTLPIDQRMDEEKVRCLIKALDAILR